MAMIDPHSRHLLPCYGLLILAVFINISLWLATHRIQPRWPNVPPPPTSDGAKTLGLGDPQLAYRAFAYQLQVMGNEGGLSTPLYQYDYKRLGDWFNILDDLDERSDYVPYLAAYYFGSTQKPQEQLPPVIHYLRRIGHGEGVGKWRWLVQAIYLAQYRSKDKAMAREMADELARRWQPGMPHWARQMPAILSAAEGDKDTAVKLMRSILAATIKERAARGEKPDPVEINFMVDFICHRFQTPELAAQDPICQN